MAKSLFAGRLLAFTGIVVFAFNLRTAVTGISPLIPLIRESYDIDTFAIALLGSIAPICFAIASFTAPAISRKVGLSNTVLGALVLVAVGLLVRTISTNWVILALGTLVALFGAGAGNIILPPLVKKYFPDRIGLLTSIYMTILMLTATLIPLVAVPVSDVFGWRAGFGEWIPVAIIGALPWIFLRHNDQRSQKKGAQERLEVKAAAQAAGQPEPVTAPVVTQRPLTLVKSPTAWAIGLIFAVSTVTGYSMFAWMPVMMVDYSHVSIAQAGALLALFAGLGAPFSVVIPVIAQRLKHTDRLIHIATLCFAVGYGGWLLFPTIVPWLWVCIFGAGPMLYPLAVVLINLRTESQAASLQLSGFTQAIAFGCASLAPPLMGLAFEVTGGWGIVIASLGIFSLTASLSAFILQRGNTVERELYASSQRSAV
jgi:CP family cyanate transporter-like MFS transporter